MLDLALQIMSALLYANLGEWLFHKYILHGLGQHRNSFWAFHCYEHHAICAKHGMLDPGYRTLSLSVWNAQTKELAVMLTVMLLHAPLIGYFPVFCLSLYASLGLYYAKHRKAHLDPVWAREHLSWHYQHHIDASSGNWCVTWPLFDYLLGTRSKQTGNQ